MSFEGHGVTLVRTTLQHIASAANATPNYRSTSSATRQCTPKYTEENCLTKAEEKKGKFKGKWEWKPA